MYEKRQTKETCVYKKRAATYRALFWKDNEALYLLHYSKPIYMESDKQTRPAHMKRDKQNRPAYMKRDLLHTGLCFERTMKRSISCIIGNPYISKETNKRDLHIWKETCVFEKRPANMQTGLCFERTMKCSILWIIGNPYVWKETNKRDL